MKKELKGMIISIILITYILIFIAGLVLKIKIFIATSNSMQPTFKTGDVLLVKSQEHYFIGDNISFKVNQSTIVTHKIKQIIKHDSLNDQENHSLVKQTTFFLTQGDANKSEDSQLVNQEEVIGKVFMIVPKIGYLIIFLQSKIFSILLLCTSVIHLVLLVSKKIRLQING